SLAQETWITLTHRKARIHKNNPNPANLFVPNYARMRQEKYLEILPIFAPIWVANCTNLDCTAHYPAATGSAAAFGVRFVCGRIVLETDVMPIAAPNNGARRQQIAFSVPEEAIGAYAELISTGPELVQNHLAQLGAITAFSFEYDIIEVDVAAIGVIGRPKGDLK
ncbi:MAG: hypothetical protein JSW59_08830, partial [Phycisphaerales bacterium]